LNIIGVPKTIDNDLSMTESTFGFQTAVQIATEAVDKLVTTAASHNRVFILEVMGRDAGWIAMLSAIAGGAEVCLLPEFPYDIEIVKDFLEKRFNRDRGFAVVVASEGARPRGGQQVYEISEEVGYENKKLGGIGRRFIEEMKAAGFTHDMRETTLGHLQRGGVPIAYDRVLGAEFGVKAFEMVLNGQFGQMVAYRYPQLVAVPLKEAVAKPNLVTFESDLVRTALGLNICLGI
jgi:6-phosphofructokinase 1